MNFLFAWALDYALVMFAMCVDNLCWMPSSPEWNDEKAKGWRSLFIYALMYRIKTVLTDWRDIVPAIVTSFVMTVVWTGVIS